MRRLVLVFALTFACGAGPARAQMPIAPRMVQPVVDPTMIVEDRGQKLEIFPTVRASPELASNGRTVLQRLSAADVATVLGPRSLGVVYNHTLGAQGFVTGEITFKPRGDALPADMTPDAHPGLVKVVNPNVYEVVARTPAELMSLLTALKARTDLEWVELFVHYGVTANSVASVLKPPKTKAATATTTASKR